MIELLYKKTKMGRSKIGLISKVVRLPGWSHSKVPLYSVTLKNVPGSEVGVPERIYLQN